MFKIRTGVGIINTYENIYLWYEVNKNKAMVYTDNWCRLGEVEIRGNIRDLDLKEILDKRISRMTKDLLEKGFYDLYEALKLDQQIIDCLGREN